MLADYAAYLRELVDLTRHPPAEGRRGRGQRHGRPHRARRSSRACRSTSSRCTSSWTAPSRTTRPTRSTRRTSSTCRPSVPRGGRRRRRRLRRRRRPLLRRRRARRAGVARRAITALVAVRELAKDPGGTVIHNLITSQAVPEIVAEHGGKPVRTRVGHSFIKEEMARTGAIFGGEHSAHYYFRDFWRADTGMLAALHVLAALGEQDGPLSDAGRRVRPLRRLRRDQLHGRRPGGPAGRDQGRVRPAATASRSTSWTASPCTLPDGSWFNLRASNTEPLLRLNVEAADDGRRRRAARRGPRDRAGLRRGDRGRHSSTRSCWRSWPARAPTTRRCSSGRRTTRTRTS